MASASLRVAAALLSALARPTAAVCSGQGCGSGKPLETEGAEVNVELDHKDLPTIEFEEYATTFGRKYEHGSKEYWLRRGLFEQRNAEVKRQNSDFNRIWEAVAGPFADYTDEERAKMRGYRRGMSGLGTGATAMPAEISAARELLRPVQGNATLPKEFSWMHLKEANNVPDQGNCGSCWAVTAKSVLDLHYEIYVSNATGVPRQFSAQQIVSCVPNPRSCGGTGGCEGSTVELAFDWVLHNGCATQESVPYEASDLSLKTAKCNESRLLSMDHNSKLFGLRESHHTPSNLPLDGGSSFGMKGYHMLERNKERPLIEALYQHGPIAVSTAADKWYEYSSGIFDGCGSNVVVDHAVTLIGYGEAAIRTKTEPLMPILDQQHSNSLPRFQSQITKYWLIRNSWGKSWGETGFIRMKRFDKEGENCGIDNDNQEGTGCKGDTKTVTVCGMCGFLWDSVVPHFHPPSNTLVEIDSTGKMIRRESQATVH